MGHLKEMTLSRRRLLRIPLLGGNKTASEIEVKNGLWTIRCALGPIETSKNKQGSVGRHRDLGKKERTGEIPSASGRWCGRDNLPQCV